MPGTSNRFLRCLPTLSYAVTRNVTLPYCSLLVFVVGLVVIPFLTLYAVATTGYELISITTNNFNVTQPMWYDFMNYDNWITPSIVCQPSILHPGDGISINQSLLMEVVLLANTSHLLSNSQLKNFIDPRSDQYDGMAYSNSPLNNCSVRYIVVWETGALTLPSTHNSAV